MINFSSTIQTIDNTHQNILSIPSQQIQIQLPKCQECGSIKKFLCGQMNCKYERSLLCFICENKSYSAHFLHNKIQILTLFNILCFQIRIQNTVLMEKIQELKLLENEIKMSQNNSSQQIGVLLTTIKMVIDQYENLMLTNSFIQSMKRKQRRQDYGVWDRILLNWVKGLKILDDKNQKFQEFFQLANIEIKQKIKPFMDLIQMEKLKSTFGALQKFIDLTASNKNFNFDSRSINIVKNHFTIPCSVSRIRVNNLNISHKLFTKESLDKVSEFQIKTCTNIQNMFSRNLQVLKITYSGYGKLTVFKDLPVNLKRIVIVYQNSKMNRRALLHQSQTNEEDKLYNFQKIKALKDVEISDKRLNYKEIKEILAVALRNKYRNLKINKIPSLEKNNLNFKKILLQVHKLQKSATSRTYGLIRREILESLNWDLLQ